MFTIQSIIYFKFISLIIAENVRNNQYLSKLQEDNDPIIDPLELVLRSTDTEGILYCNGRVDIDKQQNKLMASIEHPVLTSPKFLLTTEKINSTTIRIRIKPDGYIGVNRINCHWNNNLIYGQTADLIIGADPGVIELRRCLAYDRRYVQCIFHVPIIARAFRNGFRRLHKFSELNPESISYRPSPALVNITDDNELVFHFEPRDRNIIPKSIRMSVNMTLSRFGSSIYYFNIEPIHTTKVDFRIADISDTKFIIRIDHNNTGTISQRLCSGHISRVDDPNTLIGVQDITETSDQTIRIKRLRPSTQYEICLRCFYEQTDQSSKEEKCDRIRTTPRNFPIWYVLVGITGVSVVLAPLIIFLLWQNRRPKSEGKSPLTSSSSSNIQDSSVTQNPTTRYDPDPTESEQLISHVVVVDQPHGGTYDPLDNLMAELTDENKVAPDTYDIPRQKNA